MPESTQPKTRFLGSVRLTTGSANSYDLAVEDGNLKINGLVADDMHEDILVEDRGEFHTLVKGKRKYPQITLTAKLRDLTDAAYGTLVSILLKKGFYASDNSTLGANRPWCLDLLWTIDGTSQGDPSNHTLQLEDFRPTDVNLIEGDLDEVEITGIAYGALTMT